MEQKFAEEAARWPANDTGWSEALLYFHLYRWRERLRDSLRQLSEAQPVTRPPEAIDAFNDRELSEGASVSLDKATTRSQAAIGELIDLWHKLE